MGEVIYRPLIEDMTWSHSRLSCFDDCPYKFFLKYIRGEKEDDRFYSSYGKFMHSLLERFYKGELTKDEMQMKFLFDFQKEVIGPRPQASTVSKFIKQGSEYLSGFTPLPYRMIAVEDRVDFNFAGFPFVGIIDYIGELDGKLYLVDNKSREMKPRSNKKTPTQKDLELDKMLRQLYIYSEAVFQKYRRYPDYLCFNCYRNGAFIREPFSQAAYDDAVSWVKQSVEYIAKEEDFNPCVDFFQCMWLCGYSDDCCYWNGR